MNKLTHKNYLNEKLDINIKDIDKLIIQLDQKHRQQRKIQFLLDIRGYLKLNKIEGSYVEFGAYKCEMTYSAIKIFNGLNIIDKYIALDTFEGEPEPIDDIDKAIEAHGVGEYLSNYSEVNNFLTKLFPAVDISLIKGDFREKQILENVKSENFSVVVVDANLWSSNKSALEFSLSKMVDGSVLFIDDYFDNLINGKPIILDFLKNLKEIELIEFNVYPPFAKAFIVSRKIKDE